MPLPSPIDVSVALSGLEFLPNRTPETAETEENWTATLSTYRDGGIYIVHYAGQSEWERHVADEIVMVIEGSTTMTMLIEGDEHEHTLGSMQMIVVPQRTWHRFVTPGGAKIMTVSPQPTDHQVGHP